MLGRGFGIALGVGALLLAGHAAPVALAATAPTATAPTATAPTLRHTTSSGPSATFTEAITSDGIATTPTETDGVGARTCTTVSQRYRVRVPYRARVKIGTKRVTYRASTGSRTAAQARFKTVTKHRMVTRQRPVRTCTTTPTHTAPPRPVTPAGAPGAPLAAPGAPPAESTAPGGSVDAFAFTATSPAGVLARWNPCVPVRYRTNLAGAPGTLAADVTGALARLSRATGLTFIDAGPTTYPSRFVPTTQVRPEDADLVIAVLPEVALPALAGDTVGFGGFTYLPSTMRVTRADLVLEQEYVASAPPGFADSGGSAGLLLLHELGHTVGLAHSTDPTQVMYPSMLPKIRPTYQNGDLSGLARVGATGGCLS